MDNTQTILELKHVIEFEVGDYSSNGHCHSDTMLIKSNYSAEELDAAFERVKKVSGLDFKRICAESDDNVIYEKELSTLIKIGVLNEAVVNKNKFNNEFHVYSAIELADIALSTVAVFEHAFKYEKYKIQAEHCKTLTGIGYGCYGC